VWRQLWRVLEISDVAILVSDVRCPLMHLPAALLAHLQLLRLPVVIVLNKVRSPLCGSVPFASCGAGGPGAS
jgi:predicted GTPase